MSSRFWLPEALTGRRLAPVAVVGLLLAGVALATPQGAGARQFCNGTSYHAYSPPGDVCNQGNPHAITSVYATGYFSSDVVCAAKGYSGSSGTSIDGSWACATGQAHHDYNGEYPRYAVNSMNSGGSNAAVGDFFYNY
jgi:hypothetical protein